MLLNETYLETVLNRFLSAKNEEKAKLHESSGRPSAGKLLQPRQWRLLHILGVPAKEADVYTQLKWERGNQVEEWAIKHLDPLDTQVPVCWGCEHKSHDECGDCWCVVGHIDAMVDTKDWTNKMGIVPLEIKSVKSTAFPYLTKDARDDHIMQGAVYGLAKGTNTFVILYVVADDYRHRMFVYQSKDYAQKIKDILAEDLATLKRGAIPVFEPSNKWHEIDDMNPYISWKELDEGQALLRLEKEYPKAYAKLMQYKKG